MTGKDAAVWEKGKHMRIIFIRHGDPDYEKDSLTEKGWREAALAGQITGMLEGEEENKRILAQERLNRAHRQYLKMDNAAKLGKVNALLKAVSKRHGFLREDLLEGVADEGVTQDTVNFYEKLVAYLKKEQRELERLVNDGDDEDEF